MKVVITGASGDIGSAIARSFAKDGNSVALLYCTADEKAQALASELAAYGGMILVKKADFKSESSVKVALDEISNAFGTIDVLVNAAGKSLVKMAEDTSTEEWNELFDINARSVFIMSKWAISLMRDGGRIINISSIWGSHAASCESVYSATKGAVEAFTRSLAAEVGGSGITVNAVAAGMIDTKMNSCFTEEEKEEFISSLPIQRIGTVDDVVSAVRFLASEGASYITGTIIPVSGGMN